MRSNLTIGRKMMVSTLVFLLLTLILSITALVSLRRLRDGFDTIVNRTSRKLLLALTVDNIQSDMVAAQRLVVAGGALKRSEEVEAGIQAFWEGAALAQTHLAELAQLTVTVEGRADAELMADQFRQWQLIFAEIAKAARAGDVAQADRIRGEKAVLICKVIDEAVSRLVKQQVEMMNEGRQDVYALYERNWWVAVVMVAICAAVGIAVVAMVRSMTRNLETAVNDLASGAAHLAGASVQVAGTSQSLAQGASEQAASLEETSASSTQVNTMTRQNQEKSRAATEIVIASQEKLSETNRFLQQTVAAVDEINAQSGRIAKIIKMIDEIAFQTNILPLNAAVEAARAGEAGLGFAVVADEVRNLAQRSAQAAKDTAVLIEESIAKAHEGKTRVGRMARAIEEITLDADRIRKIVEEVYRGSQEQRAGIDQIGRAIVQMEQVTQSTAAHAEESAAAAEELHAQSGSMRAVVERLTDLVGGGKG